MAITTYQGWVNDGRPIKPAVCIADWISTLREHGYEVGYYPDDRHLKAQPPEDHTPYSHTPWPGVQPYPYVLASDLMPPTKPGLPSLARIGAQVVADKRAGHPDTQWIKYINWTDSNGTCWHDEWEPGYRRSLSNDRGHLHVSARTDWATKHTSYDPVALILGETGDEPMSMRFRFDKSVPEADTTHVYISDGLRYRVVPTSYQIDALMDRAGAGPVVLVRASVLPAGWTFARALAALCGSADPGELGGADPNDGE